MLYIITIQIYILKCNLLYFCDEKAEFSAAITPVVSFTRSFRNVSILLIWCSFLLINVKHRCADLNFLGGKWLCISPPNIIFMNNNFKRTAFIGK